MKQILLGFEVEFAYFEKLLFSIKFKQDLPFGKYKIIQTHRVPYILDLQYNMANYGIISKLGIQSVNR